MPNLGFGLCTEKGTRPLGHGMKFVEVPTKTCELDCFTKVFAHLGDFGSHLSVSCATLRDFGTLVALSENELGTFLKHRPLEPDLGEGPPSHLTRNPRTRHLFLASRELPRQGRALWKLGGQVPNTFALVCPENAERLRLKYN